MTVSEDVAYIGPTPGNGATKDFVFNKRFDSDNDLIVKHRLIASPYTITVQTLNVDYTIVGSGPPYLSGAIIRHTTAPPSTVEVLAERATGIVQDIEIGSQLDLPTSSIEQAMDIAYLVIQEQNDKINRSVSRDGFSNRSFDLTLPPGMDDTDNAGKTLIINADATGFDMSQHTIDELGDQVESQAAAAAASASDASDSAASSAISAAAAEALFVSFTNALSPFALTLVDDLNAGEALTTLGVSAFVQTVLNAADAGAFRTTISAQQSDATLTALAAYNTNGLLTQTAADTFTGRTITGTGNQIDVTNGSGVGGNPTLSISATYVGQTSITTLGTISTGVWSGTAVGPTKGGTGLTSAAQGDIMYASAADTWAKLSKSTTATRYLSNTGSSNNPAWAQVDLSNGVTGNLPVTNLNGGSGASSTKFWCGDGTWATPTGAGDVVGPAAATNHSLVCFDGTTGKLLKDGPGVGTSQKVLYGNAGGIPSWDYGAWTLLQTFDASSSATIDFTSNISSTWDAYKVIGTGVRPATDDDELYIRVYDGSYQADASDYQYVVDHLLASSGSSTIHNSSGAAQIVCGRTSAGEGWGNAATESGSFELTLNNPSSSALYKQINVSGSYISANGNLISFDGSGAYVGATTAVSGLRFLFSTGNIAAGHFALYALKKS